MSNLLVQNIKHTNGTTAMTVDSAGIVDVPVNNNITQFTKNGNQDTSSASAVTMTGWSQMNSQSNFGFQQVGTAWTESSGSFKTSRLGVYRVYLECHIQTLTSTGPRYIQLDITYTPNGGSLVGGDIYSNTPYTGDTTYDVHTRCKYYNITHVDDVILTRIGSVQNIRVRGGGATEFDTTLMFEWLAPPV
tara:strand:- start:971 stop:1540 length:570 start_codon:yes stop_codon:yes gene_type:complete